MTSPRHAPKQHGIVISVGSSLRSITKRSPALDQFIDGVKVLFPAKLSQQHDLLAEHAYRAFGGSERQSVALVNRQRVARENDAVGGFAVHTIDSAPSGGGGQS